jgi:3-hydroxyisobutyrate dehydrogenase-like beta-hydroxyacid dehydrogenase
MKRIGFIGLGTMGTPMAKNLLKAGYELYVFNRTAEKTKPLTELGAKAGSSPAAVAEHSEVVITMLAADQAVKEMVLGPDGIAQGAAAGLIVIDSSTVSPVTSKQIAGELGKRGAELLDAPVTGSEPQAIEGKLNFLVGGKKEVYEKCLPLFEAMGKANFHLGPTGAGAYAKLANNTIVGISILAFAEGVVMAAKAGIDPRVFVEIISMGGARSGQIDAKAPKVLARDFRANFSAALLHKDLGLAGEVAKDLNLPLPVTAIVKEMFGVTMAKGYGQEDVCSVIKCYEEWAAIEVH